MIKALTNRKGLSALLILVVTVAYLAATAAFAIQDSDWDGSYIDFTYQKDHLSYGDLWEFSNGLYGTSGYGTHDTNAANLGYQYYDSEGTLQDATLASNYYGSVTFTNKSAITGTPLLKHDYTDFVNAITKTQVTGPTVTGLIGDQINVVNVSEADYGSYAVVPNDMGDYCVYVYYTGSDDLNHLVKYHVIESYSSNDTYSVGFDGTTFTATNSLTFTKIDGTNWWKSSTITVSNNTWTAKKPAVNNVAGAGSDEEASSVGTKTGGTLETLLNGDGTTYNYNEWSTTDIPFNSLIILQWHNSVTLGPITETGTLNIVHDSDTSEGNTYTGTITGTNFLGEVIVPGTSVSHLPIYFEGIPGEKSVFEGFEEAALDSGWYQFEEESLTLSGKWDEMIELPTFAVEGSDGFSTDGNFYARNNVGLSFIMSKAPEYTITVDFTSSPNATLSYVIEEAGIKQPAVEMTASSNNTITISPTTDTVTVTFTESLSGKNRVCTVTLRSVAPSSWPNVAQNLSTGMKYQFIEDAIMDAESGQTIILIGDASFQSESREDYLGLKKGWTDNNAGYTIDSGVTLLLPYAQGCNSVEDPSKNLFPYANYFCNKTTSRLDPDDGLYLTLEVPDGIEIVNYGKIVVGGQVTGDSSPGYAGVTAVSHSKMVLDGKLKMCSSSILSVTGYILGTGEVYTAPGSSNASIYQLFSVLDFVGGGYTVLAAGNQSVAQAAATKSGESYITPFNRYAMLGIQADLTITTGNYLYGYCDLYAGSQDNQTTVVIIGDSSKSGVLNLTETNSSLTASYDPSTYVDNYSADSRTLHLSRVGKTTLTITGGAALGSMKMNLSIMGISANVDTSVVTFPLPYNYDVVLKDGAYAIDYAFSLLPGASLTVGQGATLTIGGNAETMFTVYDGLFDHRKYDDETFSAIKYHGVTRYTYPNTQRLQANCFGGNGAANLIVDGGTLALGAKAAFGGLIQTTGTGNLSVASGATLESTVQYGVIGNNTYMVVYSCYAAGATVSTVAGRVVDPHTGKIVPLTAGLNYSARPLTSYIDTFTYTLYTDPDDTSVSADYTDTLNAQVQGAWYSYTATLTDGTNTSTAYFAHGADVSNYYTDTACSTAATTVTANNQTYYYTSPVARVDWADGSESTHYPTVHDAVAAATHAGDTVVLCQSAILTNEIYIAATQNITLDLNDFDLTGTVKVIRNYGTLMLNLNGGSISVNVTESRTDNAMEAVYNAPGATMTINGGTGADGVQGSISNAVIGYTTIISSNSGQSMYYASTVRNEGTMTLANVTIHHTADSTNCVALINYDTGVITSMHGVTINSADAANKGYAIYNLGGTITEIESCYIYGYYGIYNRNISTIKQTLSAGRNTNSNRYVAEDDIGLIGTITDTTISATYRYGIYNAGLINSITGTTAISATGRYPIFNNYTWYYDSAIVHAYYEDIDNSGNEDLVSIYDQVNRPTIDTISGNVTLSTADYGIWNGGFINTINGNTISITTTGSYGILNFWQINEIKGKVTFNVTSYAIYNGLNSASNYAYAYTRQDYCRVYGVDDVEFKRIYSYTFGDSKIGSIGGASTDVITINATGRSGAIVNKGEIALIGRGVTINVTYTSNLTSSQTLLGIHNHETRYSGYTNEITVAYEGDTKLTYEETEYAYANQVVTTYHHKPSTIDKIDGGTSGGITINMKFTYANTANTDRTVSAIYNAGVINSIKYVTVSSPRYKIPDSSSTIYNRPQCAIYNVAGGSYSGEVQKISYYYSNSKFAINTSKSGTVERLAQTLVGTVNRDVSTIGEISNCTISTYRYALTNYGYVGSVINSSIKTTSTYAIKMDARHTYRVVYSLTPEEYAAQVDFATDTYPTGTSTSYYGRPILDLLGAGNTLQSSSVTIRNIGLIREIDGGGTTKIVATSTTASLLTDLTSGTITNGGCLVLTNEDGTTYALGGEIGKISNVTVTGKNSVGILNYSNTANYEYTSVIGELGEGLKVYSTSNYAVYSKPTNSPTEIRLISGGDYCGNVDIDGDGTVDGRDSAIHLPDQQFYGVNLHGAIFDEYGLSTSTRTTSVSGTNRNCYYVVATHTHSFTNGFCECGMFQFYGANVTMGNNLDMMFAFPMSGAESWTGYYVVAARSHADGTTTITKYELDSWVPNGDYHVVTYSGFAAKEMCDTITLIVCNADGIAVSDPWVDSMQSYAMRMLKKAETGKLKNLRALIVDLLHYGAAAQTYFGYDVENLANAQLDGYTASTLRNDIVDNLPEGTEWLGSNLTLESNIQFKITFKNIQKDMYARVEYTDHFGNPVDAYITVTVADEGMYFVIPGVVVADATCPIKLTVYTDSTMASVYTVCEESIEAYVARQANGTNESKKAIAQAFMIFADSAYTYLHNRNATD